MSNERAEPRPTVFEVVADKCVADEAREQLAKLAIDVGLTVVEKSSKELIGTGELRCIAAELWDEPAYGLYAAGMMAELRARAEKSSIRVGEDKLVHVVSNVFGLAQGSTIIGDTNMSHEEIDFYARQAMDKAAMPFEIEVRDERDFSGQIRKIVPREITKDGLAKYLRSRSLDRHCLHGAQGKALDVLCIASGVGVTPAYVDNNDGFINYGELKKLLNARCASSRARSLDAQIDSALEDQWRLGRPKRSYEVVVEIDPQNYPDRGESMKWESISLKSLQSMGQAGHAGNSKQLNAFLANIYEEYDT